MGELWFVVSKQLLRYNSLNSLCRHASDKIVVSWVPSDIFEDVIFVNPQSLAKIGVKCSWIFSGFSRNRFWSFCPGQIQFCTLLASRKLWISSVLMIIKGYYLSPKQGLIRRYRWLQQRHPLQAGFWLLKVDFRQFDQCETNSHFVNS